MAAAHDMPFQLEVTHLIPAAAAGVDTVTPLALAPYPVTVISATYVPVAAITAPNGNGRSLNLINRGGDGTGTTNAAALTGAWTTAAFDGVVVPLNATAANLTLAAGEVLAVQSLHTGTGVADPGGLLVVRFNRADGVD